MGHWHRFLQRAGRVVPFDCRTEPEHPQMLMSNGESQAHLRRMITALALMSTRTTAGDMSSHRILPWNKGQNVVSVVGIADI